MTSAVREHAPAKVNLALAVTGRRLDGYHLLDTLVVFAEAGDSVVATADERISLKVDGPFAGPLERGTDNIAIHAAQRLADDARSRGSVISGARLELTKTLPVAAGLGGGSADAAAILRALNRLWHLHYGPDRLAEIGAGLGADVAMCVHSRALRARGIGQTILLLDTLPLLPMVLANPGVAVPTKEVFAARSAVFSAPLPDMPALDSPAAVTEWLADLGNDLQAPARTIAPIIDDVLDALRGLRHCLLARMSGSGATCFAIFPDVAAARHAAESLAGNHPGWWVCATAAR